MRRLWIVLVVIVLTVSILPVSAQDTDCNADKYIARLESDMATATRLLQTGSTNAYNIIANLHLDYATLPNVPPCAAVLHQNAVAWFAGAEELALLGRNIRLEIEDLTVGQGWYELYFTKVINSSDEALHTGAPVEEALIALINSAQNTIDAALFELNAPDTTAALLLALERGVRIRIVADDEHNLEDPESTIEELIDAGAEVISDERSALMHSKFLVVDSQIVWTGSMNLTRNGMYNNNNNAMLIRSPELAFNYLAEFNEMFVDQNFTTRDDSREIFNRVVDVRGTRIETYFAPEDGARIEQRIVDLVNNARLSVHVMAFSFTLDSIGTAMVDRFNAGVEVGGVFETTGSLRGQMTPLYCAGVPVRQDTNPNIMHHKVFIIDEEIVVMGSFNFSASARDNNTENLLIIFNADIARSYLQEWQRMFDLGREVPLEDITCE